MLKLDEIDKLQQADKIDNWQQLIGCVAVAFLQLCNEQYAKIFSSKFSDVDKVREIDNLDKEIRILQATNDQCTKENLELRKSISEMEGQLKLSHDEVNEAQTSHSIARTKLVILQTKFIASLSSVMHRISGGGNLNYNTFESCVDILSEVFSQPDKNALVIRQVKEALSDFKI